MRPYQAFSQKILPQGEFISPEEDKSPTGTQPHLCGWAEQNRLADGSIKVPEVLQKYLGGLEVICKK